MRGALTLDGWTPPRLLSAVAGAGMAAGSMLAMRQYYAVRYPTTGAGVPLCEGAPLLSCDAALLSSIGTVGGVPLGWFGLLAGSLVLLGALLPSLRLERTNRALAVLNGAAVIALLAIAALVLKSLCIVCTIYGVFSLLNATLFLMWRDAEPGPSFMPAPLHVAVATAAAFAGGWGLTQFRDVAEAAETGSVAARAVGAFYALPTVAWPSEISPYFSIRGSDDFDDAPVRIVEYADPLCIDCQVFYAQMKELAREFPGRINIAYQFFPLEGACNDVVAKDKNPGACDLSYIMAADPTRFIALHDEIYDNMQAAKDRGWQADLARRHGLEWALTDDAVQRRVHALIRTGREYERTSDSYAHGIRSTPTLIINNRMIIGTLPLDQLRAIFRALIDEHEHGGGWFLENWIDSGCVIDPDGGPPKPCTGS
jgi:uncharacterized membrane protein/protein-disulfide isomerase